MDRPVIAVWFSCGAASAVAAWLTVARYGATHDIRLLNNPVDEEDQDNRRFAAEVAALVGLPLEIVTNPHLGHSSARRVWADEQFMAGVWGAPCTKLLKKEARQIWELDNPADWHVLGFTTDERERHERFVQTERSNVLPVLIDAGYTKANCFEVLERLGIAVPRKYREGYPNGNCIGCVKSRSPAYWNLVRRRDPEVFADRLEQSRNLNVRLVEYREHGMRRRIFLHELREDHTDGRIRKVECGIFCEEPRPKRIGK